ncbi:hypothetical protein NP493_190g03005 [Ridgeia piscesae]|uniref:Guanylate cyclase n=1 Tax=Ridgeia piscesae TaxID=27915 RepID=A0AAD9P2C9_RIDPI|nr:hypothetical protein NP493_190g03005 [Ridgeia piscesae]
MNAVVGSLFLAFMLTATTTTTEARQFNLGLLMPRRHIRLGWDKNAAAATMAIERAEKDGILTGNTARVIYKDDRCKAKYGAGNTVLLRDEYDVDAIIGPPCSECQLLGDAYVLLLHFYSSKSPFFHVFVSPCLHVSISVYPNFSDSPSHHIYNRLIVSASIRVSMFVSTRRFITTKPAALLASFWNLPIFSQASSDPALIDKSIYTTLVRMGPPFNKLSYAIIDLFKFYGWERIVMISRRPVGSKHVFCDYVSRPSYCSNVPLVRSLEVQFEEEGMRLEDWMKIYDGISDEKIEYLLDRAKQRSRIVLLCASSTDERRILLRASRRGMTDGNYVFFTIDHLPEATVWQPWRRNDQFDEEAKAAYQSVVHITVGGVAGPEVDKFRDLIPVKMAQPPWNYNKTLESGQKGSEYSLFLFDIVYLYLLALNDTLTHGGDPRNGSLMFANAKTKTFDGATGHVVMDPNGDRHPFYWVWDLRPGADKFEVWTEIRMTDPPGKRFRPTKPGSWNTPDNKPPPDSPPCGFFNEFCPEDTTSRDNIIIGSTVSGGFVIVMCLVGFMLYRRRKFEEELKRTIASLWKLTMQSIGTELGAGKSMDGGSHLGVDGAQTTRMNFGYYKGNIVAIKWLNLDNVHLHRGDLVELKWMRETTHENLNQFVGACFETPNTCILMGYCSRGRLQTILGVEEIKLDWMFKISLMTDLANGMHYLHTTPLRSHGFLKSSSCVVDNRWMLKVSDFGLNSVRRKAEQQQTQEEEAFYREMLWTAPELLRLDEMPVNGTQAGDVYSFAIIVQEILFRTEPFPGGLDPKVIQHQKQQPRKGDSKKNHEGLNAKHRDIFKGNIGTCMKSQVYNLCVLPAMIYGMDMWTLASQANNKLAAAQTKIGRTIVEDVKSGTDPLCRPIPPANIGKMKVDNKAIHLMEDCWFEDPTGRPSFASIKQRLKVFNKGKKLNIMDNMLSMMEKYANNLEELVEVRTSELVEEKKKTDMLLYRMLPQAIAERLKHGHVIEAEIFENVTIYFSDIVGFTSLSSISTPIQVVNLLNDLYTLFDDIIGKHDVYKVETIGDAYMVASGLPTPNGERHASEIANMSLDLLSATMTFRIRHCPERRLRLRIGIHTGFCAAGVVGLTMPRYCLFGDTINTASRMESNGEALKIHMSETTHAALLRMKHDYIMTHRGEIEVKGKGTMKTYWLYGKKDYDKPLPEYTIEESTAETKP